MEAGLDAEKGWPAFEGGVASSDGRDFHVWRRAKMQSRRGLRLEGAWLVRVGGASTCGGGATSLFA